MARIGKPGVLAGLFLLGVAPQTFNNAQAEDLKARLLAMRDRRATAAQSALVSSAKTDSSFVSQASQVPMRNRLYFENGDRLAGKLTYLRSGKIGFSALSSSDVQAKLEALQDLATKEDYETTLSDGTVLVGRFVPNGSSGTFQVVTKIGSQEVPISELKSIETLAAAKEMREAEKATVDKVWNGYVDFGYTQSTGNSETDNLNLAAEAIRETKIDKFRIFAQNIKASNANIRSVNRTLGQARFDVFLPKNKYYFMQGQLENDKLRLLDLRTTLGVGLGQRWFGAQNFEMALGLGYSFVREAFTNGTDNSEGSLLLTFDYLRDINSNLRFEHHTLAYPKTDGEFRFNANSTFASKISDTLSFTLGLVNIYDSDPPGGAEKSDFTLTAGLRRNF